MKKNLITYISLFSLFTAFILSPLEAHVKFKVESGPGFENHPTIVKKIENYLNEKVGTQLDHNALIYLKVLSLPGKVSDTFMAYTDKNDYPTECKKGVFNTAMQDAILKGSTSDTIPHGVIWLGKDAMDLFHDSNNQPLSDVLQTALRHEITHGLGISSQIEDSASCDEASAAEGFEACLHSAAIFEHRLIGNESALQQFCQQLLELTCPQEKWTTFDLHVVDHSGLPLVNAATLLYQGIDFCSLDADQKDELAIYFRGKNSESIRLETMAQSQLHHIHPQFPFDQAIMNAEPPTCPGKTEWMDFEVNMLKDLGYKVNTLNVKNVPVYSNKLCFHLEDDCGIMVALVDCQTDAYPVGRHNELITGKFGLGHLTNGSHILIQIFNISPREIMQNISIPFKQLIPSKTIPIQFKDKPYQLKAIVQHPYQGEDGYYVEFELLENTTCPNGICGHNEL